MVFQAESAKLCENVPWVILYQHKQKRLHSNLA